MAPPILVAEGEAASNGATNASATDIVRAADMTALQINRELKLNVQTANGPQTITIADGTNGYLVREVSPGMWRAQLFDAVGQRATFNIPDGCFILGAKHSDLRFVISGSPTSATHDAVGYIPLNDPAGNEFVQSQTNSSKQPSLAGILWPKDDVPSSGEEVCPVEWVTKLPSPHKDPVQDESKAHTWEEREEWWAGRVQDDLAKYQ